MSIETIKDYNIYIDTYSTTDIKITNLINQSGRIYKDESGNLIGNPLHPGTNFITKVTTNSFSNGVILYDNINFKFIEGTLTDEKDYFLLKLNEQLKYKINARRETPTINGYVLELDLSDKQVFKVYVEGKEIDSDDYTVNSTGVTLTGVDKARLDNPANVYARIYTYENSQSISSNSLTMEYLAPSSLYYSYSDLTDGSAFSGMTELCGFAGTNGLQAQVNKTLNRINKLYEYTSRKKEVNRESKITLSTFEDYRKILKDIRFRIIMWSQSFNKMIIYNNCIWQDGESQTHKFGTSPIELSIDYEDEIILNYDYLTDNAYGEGVYGSGIYGGTEFLTFNLRM